MRRLDRGDDSAGMGSGGQLTLPPLWGQDLVIAMRTLRWRRTDHPRWPILPCVWTPEYQQLVDKLQRDQWTSKGLGGLMEQ